MSVIDMGSRTPTKPDVQQCRSGSGTLWLYASGAVTAARVGTTRLQCRAYGKLPKNPDPESRENYNISDSQKTVLRIILTPGKYNLHCKDACTALMTE